MFAAYNIWQYSESLDTQAQKQRFSDTSSTFEQKIEFKYTFLPNLAKKLSVKICSAETY